MGKDLTHRQIMAIVTESVMASVISVTGIYALTEDVVAGVLVGALISAGIFAINMFLSRNDKMEIIESQKKLNDELKKELRGTASLLREIRDEMRGMREEMRGNPGHGDGSPPDPAARRPSG